MQCASNIAILISKSNFILSQDYFATWWEVYIGEDTLQGSEPLVQRAAFTSDGILLLLESGNVLFSRDGINDFHAPSGLPEKEVATGIQTLSTCFIGRYSQVAADVAVVWYGKNTTDKLYFSRDGGASFNTTGINISSVVSSTKWTISDVQCHSLVPAVYLLTVVETAGVVKVVLIEYNYIDETWKELETDLQVFNTDSSVLSFSIIPPSAQNVVVWSQFKVAISLVNRTGNLLPGNETRLLKGIPTNLTILSVEAWNGGAGEFLVLTSNNRLFYARIDTESAVELSLGESPDAQVAVMFNLLETLFLLVNRSSAFQRRMFPLRNEVLNRFYPNTSCLYKDFVTNIPSELQYVDMGEKITFWAALIYPQTIPNDIMVQVPRWDLLAVETQEHKHYQNSLVLLNKTFTFSQKNAVENPEESTGAVAISVSPSLKDLICESVSHQVLIVDIGCPLSRHIKIRNCSTHRLPTENKTGDDDCVFTSAFDGQVHVVIDMYDGDTFISEVTGDYFVWEEGGREDYGYSATMAQAGCVQKAQTRKEMANYPSFWNQYTYKSCFRASIVTVTYDGNQPYEILNNSGFSRVTFSGSGLYNFKLKVLQPNVSFCELTAQFSVNVKEEAIKSKHFVAISSFSTVTMISAILLSISYFFYRKKTLEMHQEDRQEVERLQELKYLYNTLRQLPGTDGSVVAGGSISNYAGQRRSASHNVRRMSGAATLLFQRGGHGSHSEGHGESQPTSLEKLPEEPSSTSLQSRKSFS